MSTPELSGSWIYRSYNPWYVLGAAPQREDDLILTDADLNLEHRTRITTLEGTIEWPGRSVGEKEGLVLEGWVLQGELHGFELVGTGRPGTPTAGWEYRYYGHKLQSAARSLPPPGIRPTVVDVLGGSVLRAKTHGDSKAGEVFPIIAVLKQPFQPPSDQFLTSEFAGLWTYRRFGNKTDTTPVYKTAPHNANDLILQEADLKLETPTNWWTLQGTIEWPGRGLLDLKGGLRQWDPPFRARREGEPEDYLQNVVGFEIVGTGRSGTDTAGWEYHYRGYLTRQWPNGIAQRFQALVGSVVRAKPDGEAAPVVAPFIALKR